MENYSPITRPQARILDAEHLAPHSQQYMIRYEYVFRDTDVKTMHRTILEMVEGQDDINSRFHLHEDGLTVSHYIGRPDVSRVVLLQPDDDGWMERYGFNRRFDTIWDVPLYQFFIQVLPGNTGVGTKVIGKYHHAAFDGNAVAILGTRIAEVYAAVSEGKKPEMYPDIQEKLLKAEREYDASAQRIEDKAYIEKAFPELESFPECLQSESDACEIFDCRFDRELTERLEAYRKALPIRVSVFRLALTLIGAYLFRRYDCDAIPLMTATSGRKGLDEVTAKTMCMAVNSLVLNIKRGENETFAQLVQRVSDVLREALRHERYPLETMIDDLRRRGEDATRLWNFSAVSNSTTEERFDMNLLPDRASPGNLVFRVNCFESDADGLKLLRIQYRPSVFSNRQIAMIADGIKAMAADVVEHPERIVDRLSILGEEEKRLLLSDFQTPALPGGELFIERFRHAASTWPDLVALKDEREAITYREVDRLTDRMAALLTEKGEVCGKFVALGIARRNAFALAIYAVMKAGGAYLPLDPDYPLERVEYMLADSRATILITDPEGPEDRRGLSAEGVKILDINELIAEARALDNPALLAPPLSSDPAYIIYTSGSTGKPKGVVLSQRSLAAFIDWNIVLYGLNQDSKVALHCSFSFDPSVIALFPPLCMGGQAHILSERIRLDPAAFYQYALDEGLTDVTFSTQVGVEFMRQYDLPLRSITIGGEKLNIVPPHSCLLYNMYGPTEFTVASTGHLLEKDRQYRDIPIGRPVPGAWHYIVDRNREMTPLGQSGELCLAGAQLAEGYWGRPELTASVFVDNPFSQSSQTHHMYRTGDLARWNAEGEIEILGRIDGQVKLRGFRVELGEVETAMLDVPGVTEAIAMVRGDLLVGYFLPEADSAIHEDELRANLSRRLPDYMVPSNFVRLESLPLTPNGKVDRKKLPAPELSLPPAKKPANALQEQIRKIVADVIGNDAFGVDTSLYQAGMSSLSALRVSAGIAKELGAGINARDLMKAATVEGIEALVVQAVPAAKQTVREKRAQYPLSESQLGVYYDSAKNPASLMYNIPMFMKFSSAVDTDALTRALRSAIEAHPFLKMRLGMVDATLCQLRRDDADVVINSGQAKESDMTAIKRDFIRPFDLFAGPLYRLATYRTEDNVWLLADFHHIAFDGFSADIFLNDVIRAYNGEALEVEESSGFDIALEERDPESERELHEAEAYYREQLAEVDAPTAIPRDYPESGSKSRDAEKKTGIVEATASRAAVDSYCTEQGITPGSFFLGATALAISRFVGNRQLLLTTIYSGRDQIRYQNSTCMLVKTLPLALTLNPEETTPEYLHRVQRQMYESIEHQAVAFGRLATERQWKPEINFAFQDGLIREHRLAGGSVAVEVPGADEIGAGAKFPFTVEVNGGADGYALRVEYDASLYSENSMRTFADCLAHASGVMAAKGASPRIAEIGLMTPGQTAKTNGFNAPVHPASDPNLHGIFEARAQEKPDGVALVAVDQTLTFAELNRAANNLAGALLQNGVRKGDRVAFILGRTSHVFSAMLGIMKAGCAFIPVDPEYPAERVRHILDDSGARFILTRGAGDFENGLDIDQLLENDSPANPGLDVGPDDLAYIIYTSGSTGKPKGVMLKHRGLVNYVQPANANTHVRALLDNDCRLVSIITVSFDAFLEDAFCPLANGLPLIFASEEEANNPDKLALLFERTGGTAADFTPSRLLQYMELPAMAGALKRCRCITVGGEKFPPQLYERLRAVAPEAKLINSYGPTETTISSNCRILAGDQITIGPPLWNVVEMIVDIDGHPLPPGVVGELWIGGEGVAKGYFGNAEMTSERFVEQNGTRWYRSGDLARWTEEGDVVILGRNDGQIKLRGLRIELGEIETALAAAPGIRACAVLVRQIDGREHLCAYYSATQEWDAAELRDFLSKSLAKYMLPTAYCQLDNLPQTPSGKTDFKALPEPELMARRDYKAPKNETERIFCDIFSTVLELGDISADDDFFDLGGTSLLVTRVVIEALERGYQLTFGDVFTHPTPQRLAGMAAGSASSQQGSGGNDPACFEYDAIHGFLAGNTLDAFASGEPRDIGDLVLTGATGFLGIHILREYLRTETGVVQCLVRGGRVPAVERLKLLLVYYFDDSFDDVFDTRVKVVEGDVTDAAAFERLKSRPVDTVINCAANVKHFAAGSEIEDINIRGVENGLNFSREMGCRYIQISTTSVAGMSIENEPAENIRLTEQMLYFGQNLDNKYLLSKFLAERLVLGAAAAGEVDAKVMRVGNLMARHEDGEFQINFNTNSFVGALRAYRRIGKIAFESLGSSAEFAPIDSTADAILRLSRTPSRCCLFHPYNNHTVFMGDIVSSLGRRGVHIVPCERDEFERAYAAALRDPVKADQLSALIAYSNMAGDRESRELQSDNAQTAQVLYRLGFLWPITTEAYLDAFIDALSGLGFFD